MPTVSVMSMFAAPALPASDSFHIETPQLTHTATDLQTTDIEDDTRADYITPDSPYTTADTLSVSDGSNWMQLRSSSLPQFVCTCEPFSSCVPSGF